MSYLCRALQNYESHLICWCLVLMGPCEEEKQVYIEGNWGAARLNDLFKTWKLGSDVIRNESQVSSSLLQASLCCLACPPPPLSPLTVGVSLKLLFIIPLSDSLCQYVGCFFFLSWNALPCDSVHFHKLYSLGHTIQSSALPFSSESCACLFSQGDIWKRKLHLCTRAGSATWCAGKLTRWETWVLVLVLPPTRNEMLDKASHHHRIHFLQNRNDNAFPELLRRLRLTTNSWRIWK